jgi:uncharacterized protein YjbJ (UPF0337 family)
MGSHADYQGVDTMTNHKGEEFKGRVKQAGGDLTGDRDLKREGKVDERSAKAKGKVGEVADKIKGAFRDDEPNR